MVTFKECTRSQDNHRCANGECAETRNWNNARGHKNYHENRSHWMFSGELLASLPFLLRLEKLISTADDLLTLSDKTFCHIKHVISTWRRCCHFFHYSRNVTWKPTSNGNITVTSYYMSTSSTCYVPSVTAIYGILGILKGRNRWHIQSMTKVSKFYFLTWGWVMPGSGQST